MGWNVGHKVYGGKIQESAREISNMVNRPEGLGQSPVFGLALESIDFLADIIAEKHRFSKWRNRKTRKEFRLAMRFAVPVICAFIETLNSIANGSFENDVEALHSMVKRGIFNNNAPLSHGRFASRN